MNSADGNIAICSVFSMLLKPSVVVQEVLLTIDHIGIFFEVKYFFAIADRTLVWWAIA